VNDQAGAKTPLALVICSIASAAGKKPRTDFDADRRSGNGGKVALIVMPGGIEACASSQHWSRELQALGHTVRLMMDRDSRDVG
jgi:hypothetical protein